MTWLVVRSLLVTGCLLLAGCGPSLQMTPRNPDLTMSGSWSMAATEHARLVAELSTAIEAARQKSDQRERRQRRNNPQLNDNDADMPAMDMSWLKQDRDKELDALIRAIVPSEKLVIEQRTPDAIDFRPEGGAIRHFDTRNSSTLMTSYATWNIVSGWQDQGFVVISRDSSQGTTITERYQHRGDILMVTVTLSMPDVKLMPLSASYRRAG